MARCPYRLTNLPVAALGVAAVGLGASALIIGSGEAVVEHGFEQALASMADRSSHQAKGADLIVAARERLGVSHVAHEDAPAPTKPVTVGDRITISYGGHDRILSVAKIDRIDSTIVPASAERPAPLLLVTCRDVAKPDARPVRFLIEADETLPALSSPPAPRTL